MASLVILKSNSRVMRGDIDAVIDARKTRYVKYPTTSPKIFIVRNTNPEQNSVDFKVNEKMERKKKKMSCGWCHTYHVWNKKCGQCKKVYYCDQCCQRSHWIKEHMDVCC